MIKPIQLKPFNSGIAARRVRTSMKLEEGETKEENVTSHSSRTTNHMENNFHLSNKKAIYYNMKIYYEATKQSTFDFLPLTYHIKDGLGDTAYAKFEETYRHPELNPDIAKYPTMGKELWIVKPGENTNRGCGITVCRELS